MLRIENLTKTFGDITAIRGISFEVEDGEFIFITGPSGSGKTTLLRLILRELTPDSGKIYLDGKNILDLPRKFIPLLRQQIGVVFQDFKVLPERTVRENVEVALAVVGVPENEWDERVNSVLDLVGLSKRSELFPAQLSGGELQRVSLARALAVNPKVILADEPTGNLDWDTADEIADLFQKINDQGKTIIMATHHKLIIDKLKKKTIVLENGTVSEIREVKTKKTKEEKEEKKERKAKSKTQVQVK